MSFQGLVNSINNIFTEIVALISEIITYNDKKFKKIVELNNYIDSNINHFVSDLSNIIKEIQKSLMEKVSEIDINKLKKDIEIATSTFMGITDDLEILSYNTICKTLNLGEKGATIAYISKEIKKHSDKAKFLLKEVGDNFNKIYEDFTNTLKILDSVQDNFQFIDEDNIKKIENIPIITDVSKLIEYSQFHDIFVQQIAKIEEALSNLDYKDESSYQQGRKLKIFERSVEILNGIKDDIVEILGNIKDELSSYIYNLNSDTQNILSKTVITERIFSETFKESDHLFNIINDISKNINEVSKTLMITQSNILDLKKFSKSFNILIVVTSIEIAKIGNDSLYSLVDSMNKTHNKLQELIEILFSTINIWKQLSDEIDVILEKSRSSYSDYEKMNVDKKINDLVESNNELESQLKELKAIFHRKDYSKLFEQYEKEIKNILIDMIQYFNNELNRINDNITDSIRSSNEFIKGYTENDIYQIKANEEDLSQVEFF
ncbi:hypothetical protein [Deferribacter abyssi]|uniref:hypothetical protein n=1 Tax=Deferribacter abyssi TaxID=213806 RepID=UPI003C27417E